MIPNVVQEMMSKSEAKQEREPKIHKDEAVQIEEKQNLMNLWREKQRNTSLGGTQA